MIPVSEVLQNSLDFLEERSLYVCMQVSRNFCVAAQHSTVWAKFCGQLLQGADKQLPGVSSFDVARQLHRLRYAPSHSNVLSAAIAASSTDHHNQTIHETMNAKFTSFWSSTGAETASDEDTICFMLGGQLSLVDTIELTFYQADYQASAPTYYSQFVQFFVGTPSCEEADCRTLRQMGIGTQDAGVGVFTGSEEAALKVVERAVWHYSSPVYPVKRVPTPQRFRLPCMAGGALLKVELQGKVSKQEADDLFYVCLQSFRAYGHGLPGLPEPVRRLAVLNALSPPGSWGSFATYLDTLDPDVVLGAPRQEEPSLPLERLHAASSFSSLEVCQKYESFNPPLLDPASRGTDTTLERLNRELNLLTDSAVKKYGADLKSVREEDRDAYEADLERLKMCYDAFKAAQLGIT